MKKSPAERYPSVDALADDLRRSLTHEPIRARPDTPWYRASTFVRRHRVAVTAAAAMILVVGALTTFYTTRLARERDRARLEADKAARVSTLLTGLLTSADPYATRETRGEPTVRGLLDMGAARLETLGGQPELQAEMMTVIGRVYQRLGLYDKAQPLLERALALGRRLAGRDHPGVANSLNDLGVLLREKGDLAAASAALEEALGMRQRLLGREHADVAVTLVELGRAYVDQDRDELAEPLLREALAIRRKVLGEWHRNTATSLSDLGRLLLDQGDLARAEPLLRQSLIVTRRALAEDHPDVATALSNVARVEQERGNHQAAVGRLRQAVAIYRTSVGSGSTRVAASLHLLAQSLLEQGKRVEAGSALREAMTIARATKGEDHPWTATLMVTDARLQLAGQEAAAAEPLLRRALEIRVRAFGERDWRVATVRSLLGAALTGLHRYAEAEAHLLDAHRVLQHARGRKGREAPATASASPPSTRPGAAPAKRIPSATRPTASPHRDAARRRHGAGHVWAPASRSAASRRRRCALYMRRPSVSQYSRGTQMPSSVGKPAWNATKSSRRASRSSASRPLASARVGP